MRKICVVTGTRADFGLLYWLLKEIQADAQLVLQIVVTGMHLSPEFGMTYREVERDFKIDKKIEMLLSSDTPTGISKSMGLAQISLSEAFSELNPDIVVVMGDRFEMFSAATAAMIAGIPIAHIHGGETTEGAFDEAIRHSITKMSHLHFVATDEYRRRVIQLGEQPENVFNYGAPGLDSVGNLKLLEKRALEKAIGFEFGDKNLLVTFHPVTLEKNTAKGQFQQVLNALEELKETKVIFTKANADTDGRTINAMIDEYVASRGDRMIAFASMGQVRYLSALQHIDAVVGNSSSGLTEAPSFKIGTINIGDRQNGRIKADSVIDCVPEQEAISGAIREVYSPSFQAKLPNMVNPYGEGGASARIVAMLRSKPLTHILKKRFHDLPSNVIA
jgi:GDP/UDP-N,N'-diacetylbacillosamine 2-epimerase (hydrolysing)